MFYDPTKPYKHQLLELIQSTWQSPHIEVRSGLYPIFERTGVGPEVDHTDGIGTKGEYHWRQRTFRSAVQDALAMNLNDLAMARATAYKIQNHLVLPEDDHQAIIDIVSALAEVCRQRKIVMTGGETSIHTGSGFDISLTVSGLVIDELPNQMQAGDVVLGLASSGLHSNGFSKVREVFGTEERPEWTVPTTLYDKKILDMIRYFPVHGMMHLTGGSFTKLLDIAGNVEVVIDQENKLEPHPIFHELHNRGISDQMMYSTFNCGIGFVVSVPSEVVGAIEQKYQAVPIGRVVTGAGKITIGSKFSQTTFSFTGR